MALFSYQAVNATQTSVSGTISADSPRQARDILRSQGLQVHQLDTKDSTVGSRIRWSWLQRRSPRIIAQTIRDLATLLAVGVPLLEGLDVLIRQTQVDHVRISLVNLRKTIASGGSLAQAMSQQPLVYDPITVLMVEVGENSGNLDTVLVQLADFKQRSAEIKDRVLSAVLYPAVVLATAVGVSVFLMTSVVPMLLQNLVEANRKLPWPTRVLKGMSDLLLERGAWFGIITIALIVGAIAVLRTERGRLAWHRTLLKLPMIGELARKQAISRLAMVIAVLMRSGVEFLKATEIATRSVSNLVIREGVAQCGRAVTAGVDIGLALERTGVFPPVVVQVFSVGQQSGRLEEMLEMLSADYERQLATMATRLTAVLEPILILLLSIIVGFILFATILPILEAGNVL